MVALKALNPAVLLPILGVLALAAVAFLIYRAVKSKNSGGAAPVPGVADHAKQLLGNPLVVRFVQRAVQAAEASHHAALDAGILKLFPAAAPFVPVINSVADKVDAAVLAQVSGSQPAASSTVNPSAAEAWIAKIAALEKMLAELKAGKV